MRKPLITFVAVAIACMQMGCPWLGPVSVHPAGYSDHIWNATTAPIIISRDGNTETPVVSLGCFQKPPTFFRINPQSERDVGPWHGNCAITIEGRTLWYYLDGPFGMSTTVCYAAEGPGSPDVEGAYVLGPDYTLYAVPDFDQDWILQGRPIDWNTLRKLQPLGFPLPGLGRQEARDYYLKHCFEPYEAQLKNQ